MQSHLSYEPMERRLQTCLEQSKEKPIPDFTKTRRIINNRNEWNNYMLDYLVPKENIIPS